MCFGLCGRRAWALALLFQIAADAGAAEIIKLSATQREAAGIQVAVVEARTAGATQGLPAQVAIPSQQLRVVSTPLAGLVETVLVATSQPVKRGQLLARLTSPGLADVQHTYLQASAQHQLARASMERDEKLFEEGIIAQSRLEAARSHYQEVSADLAERTQALRAAGMSEQALGRLRAGKAVGTAIDLVAPIDGVVLEMLVSPGQRLEAASAVMKVARLDPLWLEIQVPTERIAEVAIGSEVTVPAAGAAGRIIAVGRSVTGTTQTTAVRAEIRSGAARLRPGQLVEVVITGAAGGGMWRVPASALARSGGRALVFVETAGGFLPQPVEVVEEANGSVLVTASFKGDERLAIKGVATLKAIQAGIGGSP